MVRQPKIADVSRTVVKEGATDPAVSARLRSSRTAPDGLYSRNSADGDSVSVGIDWAGADVRSFSNDYLLSTLRNVAS